MIYNTPHFLSFSLYEIGVISYQLVLYMIISRNYQALGKKFSKTMFLLNVLQDAIHQSFIEEGKSHYQEKELNSLEIKMSIVYISCLTLIHFILPYKIRLVFYWTKNVILLPIKNIKVIQLFVFIEDELRYHISE